MRNLVGRTTVAALLLVGGAAMGVVTSAQAASAASLQNTFVRTYPNWQQCQQQAKLNNWSEHPFSSTEYYYCATGAGSSVNLWHRHYA
jgi:hypothetical protein